MPETINLNLRGGDFRAEIATGGDGPPLLYLHGAVGQKGWAPFLERLSQQFTVYAPWLPGYGAATGLEHLDDLTDLTLYCLELLDALGVARTHVVGHFLGGMIAAEMAAMRHQTLKGLILVDAAGIKPVQGEISEIFMVSAYTRLQQRFYDPTQVPNYENYARELTPEEQVMEHSNAEMASRLCWKPYLHNPSLPYYLRSVPTSTLIVWGRQDAIIPLECGEMFEKALPNACLTVIDRCGHSPALEKPQEFLGVVTDFLGLVAAAARFNFKVTKNS